MSKSELDVMAEMIARIQAAGENINTAIERTEDELRILRTIKNSLSVKDNPKPRAGAKKETVKV